MGNFDQKARTLQVLYKGIKERRMEGLGNGEGTNAAGLMAVLCNQQWPIWLMIQSIARLVTKGCLDMRKLSVVRYATRVITKIAFPCITPLI